MLKRKLKSDKEAEFAEDEEENAGYSSISSLSSSESEEESGEEIESAEEPVARVEKENHKVLVLASRGINARQRHLMLDVHNLLPHSKKDAKLDTKNDLFYINELAELNSTDYCMFFESRKSEDLYLWMSKCPSGPSIKFQVFNVHTFDELKLTGNCAKGSRPILSFSKEFDEMPQWIVVKQLIQKIFSPAPAHKKVKPFFDHVFNFSLADNHIWFRNYQISEEVTSGSSAEMCLVEIGPRFVLSPIKMFEGSFKGSIIYKNEQYQSPTAMRAMSKKSKGSAYQNRLEKAVEREEKMKNLALPEDSLDHVFD